MSACLTHGRLWGRYAKYHCRGLDSTTNSRCSDAFRAASFQVAPSGTAVNSRELNEKKLAFTGAAEL
ncbi:hypothetical protein SAMN06265222_106155 [Neorhodopirellula lusitana]|uniref:Uncharacterized protein n=1 Tax=Neorhodopirellula lusitana TaxID=445327 RepID=A0ABY1Q7D8_9BACT|nr:hypothetical protein SAMN06265222_106155 [Neorhodopirellula lusitana]